MSKYYVVVVGEKFLGFGGKIVSEWPDAMKFASRASAQVAAKEIGGVVEQA